MDECYHCDFKRSVPGTHHIGCAKPDPKMVGNAHGVREGWFIYPILFDPIWKERWCAHYKGPLSRPADAEEEEFDNLAEGRRLRDEGIARVSQAAEARMAWVKRARRIALQLAQQNGKVTSDDVLRSMGGYPEGADRRLMGAVFNARDKDFPLMRIGWEPTTRPKAHGRPIAVWAFKPTGDER